MSLTNEILAFCPNNTGTNLESQAAYSADSNRTNGNQPGVASSMLNNKAIRQATYVASQVGEFLKTITNQSVLDNATPTQLLQQLLSALQNLPPRITNVTATGAGTYNLPYAFFCSTATCAINDTYSDGTTTFTVVATLTAGTILYATGAAAPITGGAAGTLTKTGGNVGSTSPITYYTARAPIYLEIEMCGGGGGGGADTTHDGTDGNDSTFNTTTLVAAKGSGGQTSNNGAGPGGSFTISAPAVGSGVAGGMGTIAVSGSAFASGGTNRFGGRATSSDATNTGTPAANSGAGGCGSQIIGCGGGAGGYLKAIIAAPASTYPYSVGAGGAGGAAGVHAGGTAADGRIIVTAHYQ